MANSNAKVKSAVFITFSGNCKKALLFYQTCFGGILQFVAFEEKLHPYKDIPIVIGSLLADEIVIYGSDLVHNEGRKLGNYISIFISCKDTQERRKLMQKLTRDKKYLFDNNYDNQELIELSDTFDVRWVLGIRPSADKSSSRKK